MTDDALDPEEEHDEVVAITGEGVKRRKVRNDCPICTGGTGIECAWHFE